LNDKVPVLRPIAIDSLGVLGKEPTIVIPVLLQIAETDSDVVLRSAAIKSIGRFGTNALTAQATLHSIAISDNSDFVRKRAAQVSQDLEKEKVKGSLEK
jgi:HEAT repeat protein